MSASSHPPRPGANPPMHDSTAVESEDGMNKSLGTLGAAAAGALAMYYLDPELGASRRAVLADLVRGGLPGDRRRPRGQTMRRPLRSLHEDPQSDAELRDRIQRRLGRIVSHPRAIDVDVQDGIVRLGGRVLAQEHEGLLRHVQEMAGVHRVVNALSAHHDPREIASQRAPLPV